MNRIFVLALAICLTWQATSDADLIVPGTFHASTMNEIAPPTFGFIRVSDQSGLSSGYNPGVDDFSIAVAANSHAVTTPDNSWASSILTGTIDFDLGDTFTIERMVMWNAIETWDRHINQFTVFTDTLSNFSTATNVGTFNNPISVTGNNATVFDFTDTVGRFVRIQIDSNHGSSDFTQMGEFAFGASAVPEPSSLLLMGSVLGSLCIRRRRRSSASK